MREKHNETALWYDMYWWADILHALDKNTDDDNDLTCCWNFRKAILSFDCFNSANNNIHAAEPNSLEMNSLLILLALRNIYTEQARWHFIRNINQNNRWKRWTISFLLGTILLCAALYSPWSYCSHPFRYNSHHFHLFYKITCIAIALQTYLTTKQIST